MNKLHCLLVGQFHTGQLKVASGVDFHRALLESGIVQDLYAKLLREAVGRRDSDFQILVCVCLHQLSQSVGVHNHEVLDRCWGQGLGLGSDDDSRLRKRVGLELLLGQALDRRQLLCGWHGDRRGLEVGLFHLHIWSNGNSWRLFRFLLSGTTIDDELLPNERINARIDRVVCSVSFHQNRLDLQLSSGGLCLLLLLSRLFYFLLGFRLGNNLWLLVILLVLDVLVQDSAAVLLLNDQALLWLGAGGSQDTGLKVHADHFSVVAARKQNVAVESPTQICHSQVEAVHHDRERFL
jgi:hypothetical protein